MCWKALSLTSKKKSQTPVCLLSISDLFLISNTSAFQQILQSVKTLKENKSFYIAIFCKLHRIIFKKQISNGKASNLFWDHKSNVFSTSVFYLAINMSRFSKLEKDTDFFTS